MMIKITLKQSYNDIELFFALDDEEMALTIVAEIIKNNLGVTATIEYVKEESDD